MDTATIVKTAQIYGCHDIADQVLGIADSVIFGQAPPPEAAEIIIELEGELLEVVETIQAAKTAPPTEEDLAAKNPYFCQTCE